MLGQMAPWVRARKLRTAPLPSWIKTVQLAQPIGQLLPRTPSKMRDCQRRLLMKTVRVVPAQLMLTVQIRRQGVTTQTPKPRWPLPRC